MLFQISIFESCFNAFWLMHLLICSHPLMFVLQPCRFAAQCKRADCTFYHPAVAVPPRSALKWTKTQSRYSKLTCDRSEALESNFCNTCFFPHSWVTLERSTTTELQRFYSSCRASLFWHHSEHLCFCAFTFFGLIFKTNEFYKMQLSVNCLQNIFGVLNVNNTHMWMLSLL